MTAFFPAGSHAWNDAVMITRRPSGVTWMPVDAHHLARILLTATLSYQY